jgi:hypothetical protein
MSHLDGMAPNLLHKYKVAKSSIFQAKQKSVLCKISSVYKLANSDSSKKAGLSMMVLSCNPKTQEIE